MIQLPCSLPWQTSRNFGMNLKFWTVFWNYLTVFLKWQDSDTGIRQMTSRNLLWPLMIWLNCSPNCQSTLAPRNSSRFFGRSSPSSDNCCPTGRNCMQHTISSSSLKGPLKTRGAGFEALPVNRSWRLQLWGGALMRRHLRLSCEPPGRRRQRQAQHSPAHPPPGSSPKCVTNELPWCCWCCFCPVAAHAYLNGVETSHWTCAIGLFDPIHFRICMQICRICKSNLHNDM